MNLDQSYRDPSSFQFGDPAAWPRGWSRLACVAAGLVSSRVRGRGAGLVSHGRGSRLVWWDQVRMMAVLPSQIPSNSVDMTSTNRARVESAAPRDRFRPSRRLGFRVANKRRDRGVRAKADENVDMIGEGRLCEYAHFMMLSRTKHRLGNYVGVVFGDCSHTEARRPRDVRVELECLVPVYPLHQNHSG